ncbi:MAG: sugar ABC transporter permease [Oscillospiraceae bacterium]|jgi:ABC-type sugar transport system permease subunit|nr:sugar ABC transporter permease [Oscillospiraceae bacterium]
MSGMTLAENKKRRFRLSLSGKKSVVGMIFVMPFVIGFVWFIALSLITTFRMSFSDVTVAGVSGMSMSWNSFENYVYAFTVHPTFSETMGTSVLFMLIDVPLIIFFSLFMALFINQKFRGRTLVRAIFFLPVILGAPAIADALDSARAMMIGGISPASAEVMTSLGSNLNVNIQYYLNMFGDMAIPDSLLGFIVDAVHRINTIVIASGVQIVIFLAALQSIPPSVYEAARVEGATSYEAFWLITFPMVSPLILTNVVYTIIDSFVTSPVVTLAYSTIFSDYNYGLGAVFSIVSAALVLVILGVVALILGRRTFYYT